MTKNILLIGRRQIVIDNILPQLDAPGMQLFGGTGIADVQSVFSRVKVEHVIMGGGIDLETRLEIVREIFHLSDSTTVHMNSPSGPESFLPFIQTVLHGLKDYTPLN